MGIFGFGKAETPAIDPREARLRRAREAYQKRKQAFSDVGALELTCAHGNRLFCQPTYRLDVTQDDLRFLPQINEYEWNNPDELDTLQPIVLPRTNHTLRRDKPETEVLGQEDGWTRYRVPPFRLYVDGTKTEGVVFFNACCDLACRYFSRHADALEMRPLYDLFDGGDAREISIQPDSEAFAGSRVLLWRENDVLFFLRRNAGPYSRVREISVAQIEIRQVEYYRMQGQIEQEMKIRGGELRINREAVWRNDLLHMSCNILADILEEAIEMTPVQLEQIAHDNRYVELAVQLAGKLCTLRLKPDALEVLHSVLLGYAFEQLAIRGRDESQAQTPAEQLGMLADLLDRGYLTRAEFEEAKARLLGAH